MSKARLVNCQSNWTNTLRQLISLSPLDSMAKCVQMVNNGSLTKFTKLVYHQTFITYRFTVINGQTDTVTDSEDTFEIHTHQTEYSSLRCHSFHQ